MVLAGKVGGPRQGFLEPAPGTSLAFCVKGAAGLEIAVASDLVMCSRESIREVVAGIARNGGL